MPSPLHEALLQLFRNRPSLAPELLRDALNMPVPEYTEARIDSADLTMVQPAEYRADLVVLLLNGKPVLGVVVEVQLLPDARKAYAWPVYAVSLRVRLECPVCLLVVTAEEATARWAAKPVELGGGNRFVPLVLGPSGVPVVTSEAQAREDPELAVLSAMAHGRDADVERSVRIVLAAQLGIIQLDDERMTLYSDLIFNAASEAARKALQDMKPANYEYQSEIVRRWVAQGRVEGRTEGREEGRTEGRADLLLRQLALRFGPVSDVVRAQLASASMEQLDAMGERLLSASTLQDVLESR